MRGFEATTPRFSSVPRQRPRKFWLFNASKCFRSPEKATTENNDIKMGSKNVRFGSQNPLSLPARRVSGEKNFGFLMCQNVLEARRMPSQKHGILLLLA